MDESGAAGLAADEREMVVETLREILRRHLPDARILALDAEDDFPDDVIRELLSPDVGLHLLFLPEDVGGLGGGARDICAVSEEMASVDLGVATAFLAICLGTEPILVGGTEAQRAHWLTRIAAEGLIVAYAVTEPEAGSNVAALQTTAARLEDPDGSVRAYRLDGAKQFITNGGVAQLYTVLARAPEGPSFFIVERERAGLSAGKQEDKHGIRASNTTSVTLEGVEVPADHLVGGVEGLGLRQAGAVFGYTRLMVGAFGLGCGRGALERAVRYARERIQFGEPLIEKEGYALKLLVPHHVDLEAGRAYVEEVARRIDAGEADLQVEGAIAKYWCTEAGNRATDAALQAHGGYGYVREYMVEKLRRDVRITSIYEGTSEILQSVVGVNRWKAHVKSRGMLYRDMAGDMHALHGECPDVGAGCVAAAAGNLAAIFDHCHMERTTRHQIVIFALADLATRVEIAAAACRKAEGLVRQGDAGGGVSKLIGRVFARAALDETVRAGRLCAVGFAEGNGAAVPEAAAALMATVEAGAGRAGASGHWRDMAAVAAHLRTPA